jgi:hypothetical protein
MTRREANAGLLSSAVAAAMPGAPALGAQAVILPARSSGSMRRIGRGLRPRRDASLVAERLDGSRRAALRAG